MKPTPEANLIRFSTVQYSSTSHTFNKAVVASYNNVSRYGFNEDESFIHIPQAKRDIYILKRPATVFPKKKALVLSEFEFREAKKIKEVCYDLRALFDRTTSEVRRGIRFADRKEVEISDYSGDDTNLDLINGCWKRMKEEDGKTYLMTFNPARYKRSYELKKLGYHIYQKIISIRNQPYALINFALDDARSYELSFLSLFADKTLKLVNDQNDCIIIHCLHDLWKNFGIKTVNLGTAAGIKGLAMFKKKLPNFEQIVYSRVAGNNES